VIPFFATTVALAGVPELSEARIEADILSLSDGSIAESRNIQHPGNAAAQQWIADAFRAIDGLEVHEDVFDAVIREPDEPDIVVPGIANVVADLPGADPSQPWILITAHLDSTGSSEDGYDPTTDPAPGADDDASGVAAALEIARVLSTNEYEATIRFIAFNAEEEGLLGAFWHAGNLDGQPIRLVMNMDPVGFNPFGAGVLWATYDARFPDDAFALETLAPELSDLLTVLPTDSAMPILDGARRSDHAPFWDEGYAALHLASFPQPGEYHTAEDTIDVVDPEFTVAVATLVAHHAAELAVEIEPEPEPMVDEKKGCGCVSGGSPLSWWPLLAIAALLRRKNFIGPCHD